MVIVDSTVWIDFFNGVQNPESAWLDIHLDQQRLGLTTLILYEVLLGVRHERQATRVKAALLECEVFETGSTGLALQAASHYRTLRDRGYTVRKPVDVLIATFCLQERHSLLHRDLDFDPFETLLGLSVVHP